MISAKEAKILAESNKDNQTKAQLCELEKQIKGACTSGKTALWIGGRIYPETGEALQQLGYTVEIHENSGYEGYDTYIAWK